MTLDFTWDIDTQSTGEITLRTRSNQFGDGYQQVSKDGINNKVQSWPVVITGYASLVQEVYNFLDARGGSEPFNWTPPLGVPGLYLASKYTVQPIGGTRYRLAATFKQWFSP